MADLSSVPEPTHVLSLATVLAENDTKKNQFAQRHCVPRNRVVGISRYNNYCILMPNVLRKAIVMASFLKEYSIKGFYLLIYFLSLEGKHENRTDFF